MKEGGYIMIAIMTWKEDLNEELKLRLDGSRIMDSIEELEDVLDYLDKVILTRHLDWSLEELRTVLKNLKDSGIEIFYIKESDTPEELSLLIELDVKNILFNPKDVDEIVNKIENISLFDEDYGYEDKPKFIVEIDEEKEEKEEKEESKEESKKEKDIIKIENTVDVEKIVKQAVENVQPVVTVKQESTFRFLLNWVYKIISLTVTLIGLIIENIMWILLWAVLIIAANYFLKEQGIDSFTKLIELVKEIIQQFTK